MTLLRRRLHKPGEIIWHFANGRCGDEFLTPPEENKGYGNSMTTPWDVADTTEARQVLLSLCETVATRMRTDCRRGSLVAVSIRDTDFRDVSRQMPLPSATNVTGEIFEAACRVLDALWDKKNAPAAAGSPHGQDLLRQLPAVLPV